eukprot:GHVU01111873.1.p2 GENE.GHVU01111873.1~~GHVU01111873.1.p2  ORF type:complete len:110 (-),score=4.77 GHVU01111873.1:6-335(-)
MSDRALTVAALLVHVCVCVRACVPSPVSRQQSRRCRGSNRLLFGCRWIQAMIQTGTSEPKLLADHFDDPDVLHMSIGELLEGIYRASLGTSTPASKGDWEEGRKEGNEE